MNKLKAYALQDAGYDTVTANSKLGFAADLRDFNNAAQMISFFGIKTIKLLTNNPRKVNQIKHFGIQVIERIPIEIKPNRYNRQYLKTKMNMMNHIFKIIDKELT